MTKADSDKRFKTAEHRRERRKLKETDLTDDMPADSKTFGNPWASEKDGKQWIDRKRFPELMRK
jgi:hypothetical protein